MVIVKLVGGLGNQMFQYAAGRQVALINRSPLKLDLSSFNSKTVDTPRKYTLNVFNIEAEIATDEEIRKIKNMRGSFTERVIANRLPFLHRLIFVDNSKYFLESSRMMFDNRIHKIKGDAYLDGWWQSEKYFKDIADIIRKDFTFRTKPNTANMHMLRKIKSCNSLSIHVRRGDYVSNKKYHSYFAEIKLGYFHRAVELIAAKSSGLQLFIFSDDPVWVKKNLKFKFPAIYVYQNTGKADYEDLRLMAACRHNIIVNSSFSWWAAWLNNSPNKIVIAPQKWFRDTQISTKDRLPNSWVSI